MPDFDAGGLLDRLPDGTRPSGETFPSVVLLHRTSEGALCLEDENGWRLTAAPRADRYVVERPAGAMAWFLEEDRSGAGGFVLRAGESKDAPELGRTTRGMASAEGASVVSLLLEDGRLFRMVTRGASDRRFELLGWELDGAYLVARHRDKAWRISRTTAGLELKTGSEALVLFGAELLASELHEI